MGLPVTIVPRYCGRPRDGWGIEGERSERPRWDGIVISGDCLITGDIGVMGQMVWIDAHPDFHTPSTSISGHPGGMALALKSGFLHGAKYVKDPYYIHLMGVRDIEDGEDVNLSHRSFGPLPKYPAWVHIDTDVLDLPASDYYVPGGWTLDVLWGVIKRWHPSLWTFSMHNPEKGDAPEVVELIGRIQSGY